ncbi:serine/threonine protein kinase, partial [bacterium]|nr:serine/threonine protein kinase [bacterium]
MELAGYTLTAEIGRGGMGAVYRARSREGREVAIKLVVSADKDALARFERERRLIASLGEAEGFVPLLDAGTSGAQPFLAMPFLGGGPLKDLLGKGPLPVEEARALGEKLARAVGRAHARGIVHRDLKPANVLFAREGEPATALIADLGLAKHFRDDVPGASRSRSLTGAGVSAGSLGYMAPEQIDDARRADPRSDVFSLGVVLYECLSGERPYGGSSLTDYVKKLEATKPPSVAKLRPGIPRTLARAVERAIHPRPEERFEDASELARALRAARTGRGTRLALVLA